MAKILLDPGHNEQFDNRVAGYSEATFNLSIAKKMQAYAHRTYNNMQVDLTRTTMAPLVRNNNGADLTARAARANSSYDMFYSVHSDASGNTNASGATIYGDIRPAKTNHNLSNQIVLAISRATGIPHNGVRYRSGEGSWTVYSRPTSGKSNYYAVLRNGNAKLQLLVEHGFHTNAKERGLLSRSDIQDAIAKNVMDVVATHFKLSRKTTQTTGVNDVGILGSATISKEAMVEFITQTAARDPKLTCSLQELVTAFYEEGRIEGVKPELALALSIKETGWWQYGGIVLPEQNNFGGLAAFNENKQGDAAEFENCQIGARAVVQHLRGYATKEPLKQANVDPRYHALVSKNYLGTSPTIHGLSGKWAWPGYNNTKFRSLSEAYNAGETYGQDISRLYNRIIEFGKKYDYEVKPAPSGQVWAVQITANRVLDEARLIAETLRNAGFEPLVHYDGAWYRLFAGQFATQKEAEVFSGKLKSAGFATYVYLRDAIPEIVEEGPKLVFAYGVPDIPAAQALAAYVQDVEYTTPEIAKTVTPQRIIQVGGSSKLYKTISGPNRHATFDAVVEYIRDMR